MKLCVRCSSVKSLDNFHKSKKNLDGLQIYCKACRKTIDAASYANNEHRQKAIRDRRATVRAYNAEMLRRYKTFCKCRVCKEAEAIALDLHHTDPTEKELPVSNAVSCSTDTLRREIRKCVVLCANCHRKYHAGLLQY